MKPGISTMECFSQLVLYGILKIPLATLYLNLIDVLS